MKKVITYGTYDLLHHGHVRLLERAKALGDFLVVGVTADGFDHIRGKINVSQSLTERIEGVRATGLADAIIVEEYEGQKIDDIRRLGIDVFTVGSDWVGKFDYLKEYCDVVYLDRTEGVSSTDIRSLKSGLRLGFVGDSSVVRKCVAESSYVNGVQPTGIFRSRDGLLTHDMGIQEYSTYRSLLDDSDAVFVASHPSKHCDHIRRALERGKHVLCESPIALSGSECRELFELANRQRLVLMEGIKTAYATAYHRLLLLAKSGRIGRIVSVQATCTSLQDLQASDAVLAEKWTSATAWGPTALLPIFQLLGTDYADLVMLKCAMAEESAFDAYGKIDLVYPGAVGTAIFGKAVKSEGSLVVSGTDGYIFVPAPWWKTDYFEIRKENPAENRRFFYQLDGEGVRYELVSFARAVESGSNYHPLIERETSLAIAEVIEAFTDGENCMALSPIG
ncbi:UNVERIFIED_ORG: cytidyltransferase-like domain protein [Clostridioides difficile F501]